MVYIQITNRCNMKCAHCVFSCTENGIDMDRKTFQQTLSFIQDIGNGIRHISNKPVFVQIAGGEPTVHPDHLEFMYRLISTKLPYFMVKGILTNGYRTADALNILDVAISSDAEIQAYLSRDPFHKPIDPHVIKAWEMAILAGHMGIFICGLPRDHKLHSQGRAKENGLGDESGCCYPDLVITPKGEIYKCSCLDQQWGTVFKPDESKIDEYLTLKSYGYPTHDI